MKPGDKLTRRRPGLDRKGSNPWRQVEGRPCPRQHPCPPSCPSPSRPSARTDYPARAECMISANLFSMSLHRAYKFPYNVNMLSTRYLSIATLKLKKKQR